MAASAPLCSRLVSHLHSSTTITRFSRTSAPHLRGTVTVRASTGAQREQGAVPGPGPMTSLWGGTKSELHWPKHSLLCTLTVWHPSAVTCWGEDRRGGQVSDKHGSSFTSKHHSNHPWKVNICQQGGDIC